MTLHSHAWVPKTAYSDHRTSRTANYIAGNDKATLVLEQHPSPPIPRSQETAPISAGGHPSSNIPLSISAISLTQPVMNKSHISDVKATKDRLFRLLAIRPKYSALNFRLLSRISGVSKAALSDWSRGQYRGNSDRIAVVVAAVSHA
jgi:hypothetical protein